MADDTDGAQQAEKPRYNLIDEPWIPVRWLDGTVGGGRFNPDEQRTTGTVTLRERPPQKK